MLYICCYTIHMLLCYYYKLIYAKFKRLDGKYQICAISRETILKTEAELEGDLPKIVSKLQTRRSMDDMSLLLVSGYEFTFISFIHVVKT